MNPSVGLTELTSSCMILLTMVVLPALSSPLQEFSPTGSYWIPFGSYSIRTLISLSFNLAFLSTESMIAAIVYF